ncbi:MAG: PEGA domain-containing protein [Methanoregula sp.]|nr:PEGA domain-containing protein [Methanoregula sp.]
MYHWIFRQSHNIPNGNHVVLLRLDGYRDTSKSISVAGDTQTINLVLELKSTPTPTPINITTTEATSIPTTASVTTTTTTGALTTGLTTTVTTATPTPTATVNYSATIAAMQSQIAEQNVKIKEQGNILDQIMTFLRNVFG